MTIPSRVLLLLPQVFVRDPVPICFPGNKSSQDEPKDKDREQPLLEARASPHKDQSHGFRKGLGAELGERRGLVPPPHSLLVLPLRHFHGFLTSSHSGRKYPHLICHSKTRTLAPHAPQSGKMGHLSRLLSQAREVDVTKGICWHFLDVSAGVPFLPQEDGRFGSIFQVLFPEIATLAHNPPETHTTNFDENYLNPKGKVWLAHLPQPR